MNAQRDAVREPMHELVARLRELDYRVWSVTQELQSLVPVIRIQTPDERVVIDVREPEFFKDPDGCIRNVELTLSQLGYMT